MALSNDLAGLIGFACEAVLYGANLILFLLSLAIVKSGHKASFTQPAILLTALIFLCCTTHFAIEFNHFYSTLATTGIDGYSNETVPLLVADTLVSVTDFLGDLILIYRCWVIWGNNHLIVVLLLFTALGGLACIATVAHLVLTTDPTSPAPPSSIIPLGLAGYTLPLCTNFMVTSLIVYRIWYSASTVPGSFETVAQRAPYRAMMLIIESGMLYLLTQLVYIILFSLNHPAIAIVAVMAVQIYGIAPTLIIIRVGLGISPGHSSSDATPRYSRWIVRSRQPTINTFPTQSTDEPCTETRLEDMQRKPHAYKSPSSIVASEN